VWRLLPIAHPDAGRTTLTGKYSFVCCGSNPNGWRGQTIDRPSTKFWLAGHWEAERNSLLLHFRDGLRIQFYENHVGFATLLWVHKIRRRLTLRLAVSILWLWSWFCEGRGIQDGETYGVCRMRNTQWYALFSQAGSRGKRFVLEGGGGAIFGEVRAEGGASNIQFASALIWRFGRGKASRRCIIFWSNWISLLIQRSWSDVVGNLKW